MRDKSIGARISTDTNLRVEKIAWKHRTTKGEILRELLHQFLEEDDLQEEVLGNISEDQVGNHVI